MLSLDKKKTISILGVTGSIGSSAIDIIANNSNLFSLEAIVAYQNYKKLIIISKKLKPKYICIQDSQYYNFLKESLKDYNIKILHGNIGVEEISQINVDICISAISGFAGFLPTIKMLKACKVLAIANKETIVCGGKLFIAECRKYSVKILPIDSEHNSIYQILEGKNINEVDQIYLTASGGPFLHTELSDLKKVTLKDALNHPNWKMGSKITIDSATMVNKALEIIETYFLFNINKNKIKVLIHPQSIIHALISFYDGSAHALLSVADMRIAISHILGYPKRVEQKKLLFDIKNLSNLEFQVPDKNRFRALKIATDILQEEGIMPIVFNAANEVFVKSFLEERIKFVDIVDNIENILTKFSNRKVESFFDICNIDKEVREVSAKII